MTRWTHGISRPMLLAKRQPNIQWLGYSGLGVLCSLVSAGRFHQGAMAAFRSIMTLYTQRARSISYRVCRRQILRLEAQSAYHRSTAHWGHTRYTAVPGT